MSVSDVERLEEKYAVLQRTEKKNQKKRNVKGSNALVDVNTSGKVVNK